MPHVTAPIPTANAVPEPTIRGISALALDFSCFFFVALFFLLLFFLFDFFLEDYLALFVACWPSLDTLGCMIGSAFSCLDLFGS